ncbi:MAG: amidohydrolase family protein, partial [Planctomycetota bacterium]|nr:amidohydrolase family protein [Planctomycetota bacterium]
ALRLPETLAEQEIAALCRPHKRLLPVWDIVPPHTGEMPVEKLLADMRAAGVKALRARPDECRFLLDALTCGEVFEALSARRIPLFLPANDWARLHAVVRDFPRLRVIACNIGPWGSDRFFRPLLAASENFYLEISSYELDGGIPALVRAYGAERILFGSGFHYRPMGGAALLLRNLDLPRRDKEKIGHGNLERLIQEAIP